MLRSLFLTMVLVLLPVSVQAESRGMQEWQSICPESDLGRRECLLVNREESPEELAEGDEDSPEVAYPIIPIPQQQELVQEEEDEIVEPIPGIEIPEQAMEDLARAIWKVAEEAADELGLDRDCILEGLCAESAPQ